MLTFTGDVYLRDPVVIEAPLDGTVVVNLESPLTEQTAGYPGKINLRADAENFARTFGSREVIANLANNHIMDFFEEGLDDTLATLDGQRTRYFGLVRPASGSLNPLMLEVEGVSCALLGYADESSTPVRATDTHSGVAEPTLEQIRTDLAVAKAAGADRVAVCIHWGDEQVALPSPSSVALAHAIIDAGADIIIGHHAHCIQAFEIYREKSIFYGLGNFFFPAHRSPSYFTADGTPTRSTDSRPAPRNRRSLTVTWNPESGDATIRPVYYTAKKVLEGSFDVQRYRITDTEDDSYRLRYQRAYSWGKLRHALERFRESPKMPGPRHFRGISRMLRNRPRS